MKFYRLIESIIKKIYRIPNYTKNEKLKKTFISAEYNTSTHQDLIFSSKNKINYILKNNEEISKIVFMTGEFDFNVLKKGLKLLKKKKCRYLVSIGSHVGTTLIPAIKFGLFDNCIAFEPSIENYRLLTANIHINKIEKKISSFNIGLSNKVCNGYLKNNSLNSGDYRITKSKKNSKKIRLDVLDNFTSKMDKKNSFLFMDAQGHEPYILLGAKKTLKKNIPLIFELMPDSINIEQLNTIFRSIQNYKKITDLREDKIFELNKINFYEIYKKYKKKKFYTDIMVF